MKRAGLVVLVALFLAAAVWSVVRGTEAEAGVCTLMTPSGILEHPALAHALAEVLRSGDAVEVGRVEDLLREIRSVHGCEGDVGPRRATPVLPPGHPPVHVPFMDGDRPAEPIFEAPGTVTI